MEILIFIAITICVFTPVKMVIDKIVHRSRIRRLFMGHNQAALCTKWSAAINYDVAIQIAKQQISEWHVAHPMGALTPREASELQDLHYDLIGLQMAKSGDTCEPYSDAIFKPIEDDEWRS